MWRENKHEQVFKTGQAVEAVNTDITDHVRGVYDGAMGVVVQGEIRPDQHDKHWIFPTPLVEFETIGGQQRLWMGMHQLKKRKNRL